VHLPKTVNAEWVKQLVGEQLVTVRDRRGVSKLEWRQMRERNEALDCRVYARAAAWLLGIDHFTDEKFEQLEADLGAAAEEEARSIARPTHSATTPVAPSEWLGQRDAWL
jgi:phage terminase large subunit GpA-like protein